MLHSATAARIPPKYLPLMGVLNQAVCRCFEVSHQGENDA